jgi:peroxiredoxin
LTRRLVTIGLLLFPAFAANVPRPSPEFVIRQVDGNQKLLSNYKGKVIALEFLQTTCPHCQNCSAIMNKLLKEYGPRGFQPLGVAFNDMATLLVPDYIKQLGLDFPVGVATRDEVLTYLQFPMVQRMYVPTLVFIDRKGVIRAQYNGDDEFFKNEEANMRAMIEKLLNEPAAGAGKKARPSAGKSAKPKAANAAFLNRRAELQ